MTFKPSTLVAAAAFSAVASSLALAAAHTMAPAIDVSAQKAGKTVTIKSATLKNGGFLVIHAIKNGKPVVPASIGHARLKKGKNKNVVVKLTAKTKAGDKLLAMLHHDTGKKGVYEFGPGSVKTDKPVIVDGKPVVKPFALK